MTPAARIQAAIEALDAVLAGARAEPVLTAWGRRARYAGSGDRAAVRDLVFDALRRRRSYAALGGAESGRGLMLGRLRARNEDPEDCFTGDRHAPAPLSEVERAAGRPPAGAEALDLPDWLWPAFRESLGAEAEAAALALRHRAPVHLRANLLKGDREAAASALAAEGIETVPVPVGTTALEVTAGARRVARSRAFADGLVELQDAASQAVVDALPLQDGARVLDLCAGGGGKTLALAARLRAPVDAHDAARRRLAELPSRALRAGAAVRLVAKPEAEAPYDLVLCDVPCSGSGAWRRDPDAKWRLTPDMLAELSRVQDAILDRAAMLLRPGGTLAYATCSLLRAEDEARIGAFLSRASGWRKTSERRWRPGSDGDGFYLALLTREF
ncbi:RsmB/NOP family class I SAM-dependent RNA methyltransferase [Rhodosalinus sp.]|uniref:RsmB/NOP family class I SAM-dependent RNA methyltransferase n=1 Tax=Rhodosalinus sp. TaxID=2047741 RepID=UPI00397C9898